jgi:hypothetical protein
LLRFFFSAVLITSFQVNASPVEAQVVSGNILIDACQSTDEGAKAMCFGYITGAIEGLKLGADAAAYNSGLTGQAMRDQANEFLGACIPQEATGGQTYEVALQYMKNNPQRWHEPAIGLIFSGVLVAFPCG